MKKTILASIFIITLTISTFASADAPVLTIDSAEGNQGILTINYTVIEQSDVEFVTAGWQFSTDGGATWLDIDAAEIGNNAPKSAGSSFITWNTQAGANNLADKYYDSVSFRMFVRDPLGNIWNTKSPMPTGRHSLAAVAVDGKIYAIGGYQAGRNYFRTVEEYNPIMDRWREVAQMPTARDDFAAATVDGKIYAIGGYRGRPLRTVEEYNPVMDKWRKVAQMPTVRDILAAATVEEKIYAIGGRNTSIDYLGTVEEYSPGTDRWRKVAGMPITRRQLAAAVVDGKIYAIGGFNGSYLRIVEEYNPSTDRWRKVADMPTARYNLAAAVVDGKIYAIGGYYGSHLNTVEEYTPPRESDIATSDSFTVANQ